jgi:hypothetical protein
MKYTFTQWGARVSVLNFSLDHQSSLIMISCAKIHASIMPPPPPKCNIISNGTEYQKYESLKAVTSPNIFCVGNYVSSFNC